MDLDIGERVNLDHPYAAVSIARYFHESCERLAPKLGNTKEVSQRVKWEELPKEKRDLIVASVAELIDRGIIR